MLKGSGEVVGGNWRVQKPQGVWLYFKRLIRYVMLTKGWDETSGPATAWARPGIVPSLSGPPLDPRATAYFVGVTCFLPSQTPLSLSLDQVPESTPLLNLPMRT